MWGMGLLVCYLVWNSLNYLPPWGNPGNHSCQGTRVMCLQLGKGFTEAATLNLDCCLWVMDEGPDPHTISLLSPEPPVERLRCFFHNNCLGQCDRRRWWWCWRRWWEAQLWYHVWTADMFFFFTLCFIISSPHHLPSLHMTPEDNMWSSITWLTVWATCQWCMLTCVFHLALLYQITLCLHTDLYGYVSECLDASWYSLELDHKSHSSLYHNVQSLLGNYCTFIHLLIL